MLVNLLWTLYSYLYVHEVLGVEDRFHVHVAFLNILFGFAGLLGFILAGYFFKKSGQSKANVFFSIFLIAISLNVFESILYWNPNWDYRPKVPMYRLFFFLWAPSLYFCLSLKLNELSFRNISKKIVLHYALFVLCFLSIWGFQSFSDDKKGTVIYNTIDFIANNLWLKVAHLILYCFLMFREYFKNSKFLSPPFRKVIIAISVFYLNITGIMVLRALLDGEEWISYTVGYAFVIMFSLLIIFIAIFLYFEQGVLFSSFTNTKEDGNITDTGKEGTFRVESNHISVQKYKNSGLTESLILTLKARLIQLLEEDKIYLESDMGLSELAIMLDTDRHSASQVINQEFGKTFYELLNDYRIEQVKSVLQNNPNNESIIDIAYGVGFSNRVSFNKAFKKRTGKTPTQYLEDKLMLDM